MNAKRQGREAGIIYAALIGLLLISISCPLLHFGPWQPLVLLGTAALQGALVLLFFMHVRSGSELIWLLAGAGFLWLGILLVLVESEYMSRGWFGN